MHYGEWLILEVKNPFLKKKWSHWENWWRENELHELLLNLGVDLMLRASDLLNLKVSDIPNETGSVKKEVRVRMKKKKKTILNLPLSKILLQSSRNTCLREREKISSFGQFIITIRENLFQSISIPESSKIGWETWEWKMLQNIPLIQFVRPRVRSLIIERRMWMQWEGCLNSHLWLLQVPILGFLMRVH